MPSVPIITVNEWRISPGSCRFFQKALITTSVAFLQLVLACQASAGWKDDVGHTALATALGANTPTGAGVPVAMAEANTGAVGSCSDSNSSTACLYMPSFTNPQFDGKTIADVSGIINAVPGSSTHATGTGLFFFGNASSIAPGITDVDVYEVDDYLMNVLKTTTGLALGSDPIIQNNKVQNHSWVSTGFENSNGTPRPDLDLQALRRFDYVLDTQDIIASVGVSQNGANNDVPNLLAHSYNAIVVGRTDGLHATNDTGITSLNTYGPGRQKPDIVTTVDAFTVSRSTAVISGAASILYESGTGTDAVRSEPMKAILLAGATKGEFPGWSHTTTQPLDETFGAGELNIFNSYRIQQGGEFDGSLTLPTLVGNVGWDYGDATTAGPLLYDFEVPEFHTASELSILLAWNYKIVDDNPSSAVFDPLVSLANLDLQLFDSNGGLVSESVSTIDNLEHIYLTDLAPDTYTLHVTTNSARDFGLAWRLESTADGRAQGDYNGNGIVDAADYTVWLDSIGSYFDLRADGDLNGVVDANDFNIWKTGFGQIISPPVSSASLSQSVPEPASLLMLLLALGFLLVGHRPRHVTV